MSDPTPPTDVLQYYDTFAEESRLRAGASQLEFERTKEILARELPAPPSRVLDVGGAAGAYSLWLAAEGYEVHLVDASSRLIALARERNTEAGGGIATLHVADARALPQPDGFADAVLLMGPLYHLQDAGDRLTALKEVARVLVPGGVVAVAAISRFASALDGLARARGKDPAFVALRDRDLRDGRHFNESGHPEYFTTAYFHHPAQLAEEVQHAGFQDVRVFGVEGPGWIIGDFDERWADPVLRDDVVAVARAVESEPSIVGASAHLLAVARLSQSQP
jgi:ubiquinone/menaquinone biosynthesis C-methylase UbiE